MNDMKRIFIAIPVYQYPTPECMESVINLVGIFRDKYDLTVRLVSGYTAEVARTKSVEAFLATQCDYLLFVDSDVVISETVVDKLIEADKEAVTAIYHKKSLTVQQSEVYRIADEKRFEAYPTAEVPQTLFEITACGFGCILLRRDAVRKVVEATKGVPFRFVQGEVYISEDIFFCNELSKLGIKIWADGSAVCGHVGKFLF